MAQSYIFATPPALTSRSQNQDRSGAAESRRPLYRSVELQPQILPWELWPPETGAGGPESWTDRRTVVGGAPGTVGVVKNWQ